MKHLFITPHYYHTYGHHHGEGNVLGASIFWTFFITLYIFYIAIVCMKRNFNDYPTRKAFLLDFFIPFRVWIIYFINLFKKDYYGKN